MGTRPPQPAGLFPQRHQVIHPHTRLSCHNGEESLHLPREDRQGTGAARCHITHRLKQNTRAHTGLKQGTIIPHKVINPAQAVWVPYLSVRKCSRSKVHSSATPWWQDCMLQTAIPTIYVCVWFVVVVPALICGFAI